MKIYEQCKYFSNIIQSNNTENCQLLTSLEYDNNTIPSVVPPQFYEKYRWFCHRVYYISDIHLAHKVTNKFKKGATDDQIKRYIKRIAKALVTKDLSESFKDYKSPIVIFGGDISSYFELSEIFYTEFVEQWEKAKKDNCIFSSNRNYIYAILGNHELWDFETAVDCYHAYKTLFKRLGICFLQNNIASFGNYELPIKRIDNPVDHSYKYVRITREDDEEAYDKQMLYIHNTIIVGGIGFAGCNNEFNADMGIYRTTISREQEIEETRNWRKTYNRALALARETNSVLIVLSHNPISDWKEDGIGESGCVYFTGHSHRNYIYHDEDSDIHIFANNQIGYGNQHVHFKEAYIYNRANPFANYGDGYHEITSKEYLRFYDYMKEQISGNGIVERQMQNYGAKFYMIKQGGYYGFFLVPTKGTYICAGGTIKKISNCHDIKQFNSNFLNMIKIYKKMLSPYRNAQEKIAEAVRSFGGDGKIHGCIIDIDFLNHIILNPYDGSITYYYSPVFGQIKEYGNLLALLENHNKELANQYRKQLKSNDQVSIPQNQVTITNEIIQIDIKNSIYAVSNRMNQLQRLFDKNILRDWNDGLLAKETSDNMRAISTESVKD